jgi:hypothetical protein
LFKKATVQLYQFIQPGIVKAVNVGINMYNAFEKDMRNRYEIKQDIKNKWNILENELQTKNRYFPNSDLLSIFDTMTELVKCIYPEGSIFYRARKIHIENLSNKVQNIIKIVAENFNDYDHQKFLENDEDMWDYLLNINHEQWKYDYINEENMNIDFWGFNAKDSDAPPPNDIQGRVNPVGITYLYGAKNISTAIAEIQPTISQLVSVAEIKTLKDLNIFSFDFEEAFTHSGLLEKSLPEIKEEIGISFEYMMVFFDTISELFSKPALGETKYYYTTQYISEYIKKKGFDGIMFKSSLEKGGKNIVLFDTSKDDNGNHKNYQIANSFLHKVDNVIVSSKKVLPKEKPSELEKSASQGISEQETL